MQNLGIEEASTSVHRVKALATKPEGPSLIAGTQVVDGENRLCPLTTTHMPCMQHTYNI